MNYTERCKAAIAQLLKDGVRMSSQMAATCAHDDHCPTGGNVAAPCVCTPRITIFTPAGPYLVDAQGHASNIAAAN
ncbi:hypothetical protein OKA05_09030 [Luteolibacter arcticus]|uniref:Uncharacterized protein n=1 Tax=Luteolibacter arcticus TaxID=1581411 RepID=A0ABT3GGH1_9BACT|nr:hypothetical protein [Luteolibacter arcticus]MCW1922695.1 hypothetical protein [Luteolibacter arcticus]